MRFLKKQNQKLDTYGLANSGAYAFIIVNPDNVKLDTLMKNYPTLLTCWFAKRLLSKGASKEHVFDFIFRGLEEALLDRKFSLNVSFDYMFQAIIQCLSQKKHNMEKKGIDVSKLNFVEQDLIDLANDTTPHIQQERGWEKVVYYLSKDSRRQACVSLLNSRT